MRPLGSTRTASAVLVATCWSDDFFWIQLSRATWWTLTAGWLPGSIERIPPDGFVGRVSQYFPAIGVDRCRLRSIRLRPARSTPDARLWRLTLEWGTSRRVLHQSRSGPFSVRDGSSRRADGGAATFRAAAVNALDRFAFLKRTTSISRAPRSSTRTNTTTTSRRCRLHGGFYYTRGQCDLCEKSRWLRSRRKLHS